MCSKFNNTLSCAEVLPHILYFIYTIVYNLYTAVVIEFLIMPFFLGREEGVENSHS